MQAWFENALMQLSDDPVLQGLLAAISCFILEDPTLLMCAVLVAEDQMLYTTALVGLSLGIGLGDWGLYGIGRAVGPQTVKWGWVTQRNLDRAGSWFNRNLVVAVFISRFIPGLRLPFNLAAGIAQASIVRYLPAALTASLVWVFVMLTMFSTLGEMILPLLGQLKWPAVTALILWIIFMQRRTLKRLRQDEQEFIGEAAVASSYEFMHPVIFYIPVAMYYLWLSVRYHSLTLPTAANPSIYSGGMIRESKCDILDMLPKSITEWVADHARFPVPDADVPPDKLLEEAERAMENAGLAYPIVTKPDEGQRGAGVQVVSNSSELQAYIEAYPRGESVCLQELVTYRDEVGLLYHRLPGDEHGTITSVTMKEFPEVVGDGERTLRELIHQNPRTSLVARIYESRHAGKLDDVLPTGEVFPLVFAGNHAQGCIFRDGAGILTDALSECIESIAREIPNFYFGRFDIRYKDLESLQHGDNLKIIEINGAGAEATHIWDPDGILLDAYGTLFEQFSTLFEIGHRNRKQGHRPIGPVRFLSDFFRYQRTAKHYPGTH